MNLFIDLVLLILCGLLLYYFSQGAIFLPTYQRSVETMIGLAGIKPGARAVDLGSGDGRIVIAMAQAGALADGFEINPVLVFLSRRKIKRLGLENQARIFRQNFWTADLSSYDVVMVFGTSHIMEKLEKKLRAELKDDAVIVSNVFRFPGWQEVKSQNGVYVYRKQG